MGVNIYKPRYKIAFQSKSKLWSYKDSRLRRFFNIRGRKLIRSGIFKRIFLVFNNMKWTIARRYIRPYRRKRKGANIKQKYKNAFYNKQKLKHFYGSIKEEYFHNFFRKYSGSVNIRNKSFYSTLERRTDMFLFRIRLLPTIYAANQFIHHQGININGRIEKSSNALISPGDMLTIDTFYWDMFSDLVYLRIFFRTQGFQIWKKRLYTKLKKKMRWIWRKNKNVFKKKNIHILKKIYFYYNKIFHVLKLKEKILKIKKNFKDNITKKHFEDKEISIKWSHYIYITIKNLSKRYKQIRKFRKYVWIWKSKNYYKSFLFLLSSWIFLCKRVYEINQIFLYWTLKEDIRNIQNDWKPIILLEKNKKNKKKLKKEYYNLLNIAITKLQIEKDEQDLYIKKIKEIVLESIKRRIKLRVGHTKIIIQDKEGKTKKKYTKRNSLFYYLKFRKFKRRKRRSSPRLKAVHWYIPPYIHFDIRTMQAIYLYNPLPEEIYYSFKCSLPKIYSFYKSRGF